MVRKIEAKIVFATLVLTCGASVVYAQEANVTGIPQQAAFDASTLSGTPVAEANVAVVNDKVAVKDDKAIPSFNDLDIFGTEQAAVIAAEANTSPSQQLLGTVNNDLFKEMAEIERETALLSLKAKRDKLLADIERTKADIRKSQLDELERREQITRDRVKWEMEQEDLARKKEEDKLTANTPKKTTLGEEQDITSLYTIDEIKGINGELTAILKSDKGRFNAVLGYPLKNGYKVSNITTSAVEVSRGNVSEFLLFSEGQGTNGSSVPRSSNRSNSSSGLRSSNNALMP